MKRYILITAAVLALMSCNKEATDPSTDETGKGTYFTEGQQVTITCGPQQTKVNGTENASKGIDFTWEEGDKIQVTVSGSPSEFTLSAGAGTATATFTGQMPASGSTFDVQYPVTDPDLTSQTYIAGALPHNMMKFAKTGCTIGSAIELEAQYSALRLNLYGWDRQVSSITVTNLSDSKTYTLSCEPAVTVGSTSEGATPFLLVMPIGSYNFKASVTSSDTGEGSVLPDYIDEDGVNQDKGILITTGTMETTSAKEFTKDNVLNLSARAITQIWAPVNCGYSSTLTYGKLYQFGRKVGTTYGETWTSPSSHAAETGAQTHDENGKTSNPDDDKFYKGSGTSSNSDWYSGSTLMTWPSIGVTGYLEGKIDDPCPAGWRVPTKDELSILLGGNSAPTLENKDDQNGVFLNGTASCSSTTEGAKVFLPAAGRRSFTDGDFYSRGEKGRYYTSTVQKDNTDLVWALYFESGTAYFPTDQPSRACGFSVRCVKSEESTAAAGGFSEVTTW